METMRQNKRMLCDMESMNPRGVLTNLSKYSVTWCNHPLPPTATLNFNVYTLLHGEVSKVGRYQH